MDKRDELLDENDSKERRRGEYENTANSISDKLRGIGKDHVHWSEKSFNQMAERDWRIFREDHDIIIKGGRVPNPMRDWSEGELTNYIIQAVQLANYEKPTPIQIQGIPIGLERKDMIGKYDF